MAKTIKPKKKEIKVGTKPANIPEKDFVNASVPVSDVETKELVEVRGAVEPLVEDVKALEVVDEKTKETATFLLSRMNQMNDRIVEDREKLTVPLNTVLKNIRERYKPVETTLKTLIDGVRSKLGAYQTAQVKAAKDEEARIAARVGEGQGHIKVETAIKKMDAIERPTERVVTNAGTLKFRTDKILKITDKKALVEFLLKNDALNLIVSFDEKSIKGSIAAGVAIPGAVIEEVQVPINHR